jgi:hypothetical protein
MDGSVQGPLRRRGPSRLDWVMLAFSLLTVSWILVAY